MKSFFFSNNVLHTKANAKTFLGAVPDGSEPQICGRDLDVDPLL